MKKIVIIGASGHGKVIADIAVRNGYEEIVFLDDNESIKECAGFPVIGKTCEAEKISGDKIVAIGNAEIREKIQRKLNDVVTLIHPDAVISRRVEIGEGSVIMAGSVINSDVIIGKGCIINTGSSVDHDCKIGDFTHISVGAHVAGTCDIGIKTWIGAGATVSNNINIFGHCMVGAGSVVIRNLDKPGTYIGIPAKEKKMNTYKLIGGEFSRINNHRVNALSVA